MSRPALLVLDQPAWLTIHFGAASRTYRVRIIGETRDGYRVRAEEPVPMKHGCVVKPGAVCRVPKDSIRVRAEPADGR